MREKVISLCASGILVAWALIILLGPWIQTALDLHYDGPETWRALLYWSIELLAIPLAAAYLLVGQLVGSRITPLDWPGVTSVLDIAVPTFLILLHIGFWKLKNN